MQLLYGLVSNQNDGYTLKPVSPWVLTCTDDSTILILKGVKKTKEHTFLGSKCELEKTLSYFNGDVDGRDKLWRVMVRHTHTWNMYSNTLATYGTVNGLSIREQPMLSFITGIKVAELAVSYIGAS